MTMPNFLIVGAGKAGTTALYRYLGQHPQIYLSPVKETNFFALQGEKADFRGPGVQERINSWSVTDVESYRALFNRVSGEEAIGEASPLYLYSPKAPRRIRHHLPDVKLVAVLRDPAERAHSAFVHMVREAREPFTDFELALNEEEARVEDNWPWIWHYERVGFYNEQLRRYFDLFDREQVRVYLYEDLGADPVGVLKDIFRFLGVDDESVPDVSVRHNLGGVPKSTAVHSFLKRPNPLKNAIKPLIPSGPRKRMVAKLRNRNLRAAPRLAPEVRRRLVGAYREDVLGLQDLIGRDLSGWLKY
jgi:Sulfotransferase family